MADKTGTIIFTGAEGDTSEVSVKQSQVGFKVPLGAMYIGTEKINKIGDVNNIIVGNDTDIYYQYQQPVEGYLLTDKDKITFASSSLENTITVSTNAEWTATTDADWITLEIDGNTLKATATAQEEEKTATITIYTTGYYYGMEKKITVTYKTFTENTAQFDGNSWFDTGWYVPSTTTKMEVSWRAQKDGYIYGTTTAAKSLVGCAGTSSTSNIIQIYRENSANCIQVRFGYVSSIYITVSTLGINDIAAGDIFVLTVDCSTATQNITLTQNGIAVYTGTIANSFAGNPSYTLFVGRTNPTNWEGCIDGQLTYAKFEVDGELAHYYSFEEVDGVGKMIDNVTGEYFDNKGTGSITIL